LDAQLARILDGAPSSVAAISTASGIKDKYFQHFADKLGSACADIKTQQWENPVICGHDYLVRELRKIRDTMPTDIFSPSLRLDGVYIVNYDTLVVHALMHSCIDFNPNSHTPVEILHVILLGFVMQCLDRKRRARKYSKCD